MAESVEVLKALLLDSDIEKRIAAAQNLAAAGHDAAPAALLLLDSLDSDDESLREWANAALEECGAPQVLDLPALLEHIQTAKSSSHDVTYWALTLLGRLAEDATSAIPDLITFTRHCVQRMHGETSHEQRNGSSEQAKILAARAIWALGKIGPSLPEIRTFFAELLHAEPQLEAQIRRASDNFAA
ncbi:MAG TPA: hypothetical protein PKD64_03650 [Pirellulaceae bacterium]|nr:hypothetical protein [Pirellulaceae bacterium]HMO91265.1 hypothetical protein [Pirellulaceae bacterium]HMP68551.1 hypothetical protein [Pirellulaceae bacterium]